MAPQSGRYATSDSYNPTGRSSGAASPASYTGRSYAQGKGTTASNYQPSGGSSYTRPGGSYTAASTAGKYASSPTSSYGGTAAAGRRATTPALSSSGSSNPGQIRNPYVTSSGPDYKRPSGYAPDSALASRSGSGTHPLGSSAAGNRYPSGSTTGYGNTTASYLDSSRSATGSTAASSYPRDLNYAAGSAPAGSQTSSAGRYQSSAVGSRSSLPSASASGSLGGRYNPGKTNYVPGKTDYTPGRTGYQPPNTTPYVPPAGPYTSPSSSGGDSAYTPGSTSLYQPQRPVGLGSDSRSTTANSDYPSASGGGSSQPSQAGYLNPATTVWR